MTGSWPLIDVDHRDTNRGNDRWENLRLATSSQNAANGKLRSTNKSGAKGVHYDKARGKWVARTMKDYRHIFLGRFGSIEEAQAAYAAASSEVFGEFAKAA
jgi:hypothetical protein